MFARDMKEKDGEPKRKLGDDYKGKSHRHRITSMKLSKRWFTHFRRHKICGIQIILLRIITISSGNIQHSKDTTIFCCILKDAWLIFYLICGSGKVHLLSF